MYCTIEQVKKVLAKALTSFTPSSLNAPADLLSIGNSLNTNQVSPSDVYYYISLADSQIDAALSQQYIVPLSQLCAFETKLVYDINEYNDEFVTNDSIQFTPGDSVVLYDISTGFTEQDEVLEINGTTITLVNALIYTYFSETTEIKLIRFPAPIPFVAARLAAAALYEKFFAAQSSPANSEYFKVLNTQSIEELNNIREGRTILWGATRIANRFYDPTLGDRYGLAHIQTQDGTRSGQINR